MCPRIMDQVFFIPFVNSNTKCVCLGGLPPPPFEILIIMTSVSPLSKLQQEGCYSNILCVIHLNLAVVQVDGFAEWRPQET